MILPIKYYCDRPLIDRHAERGLIMARQFCSRNGPSAAIWASNSPDDAPRSATSCQSIPEAAAGDDGVSQGASA